MTTKYQTQSEIRRVFVRHWVDLDGASFGLHRETVRVTGTIRLTGGRQRAVDAAFLDNLETEICRLPDIRRVHFELKNWRRDSSGCWRCLEDPEKDGRSSGAGPEEGRLEDSLVLPTLLA